MCFGGGHLRFFAKNAAFFESSKFCLKKSFFRLTTHHNRTTLRPHNTHTGDTMQHTPNTITDARTPANRLAGTYAAPLLSGQTLTVRALAA